MEKLMESRLFWLILLLTIAGEFLVPWILKFRYAGYDGKLSVMSVLGCPSSPVKIWYRLWLIWLGCVLSVTAAVQFHAAKGVSLSLAWCLAGSTLLFAVGAGLLAGLFSVNETKEMVNTASKIHGCGSAAGFMALLFFPLLSGILELRQAHMGIGVIYIGAFICALVFFTMFTLRGQGATRFFGAEMTTGRVVLVAGRQPGCLVRLAGCHFRSRKTPQDLSVSKNGSWQGRRVKAGCRPPNPRTPPAPIFAADRRVAPCPLRVLWRIKRGFKGRSYPMRACGKGSPYWQCMSL